MDLPINHNKPLIMHVDLNSCFAMVEQQANPLIRNKPVAIAAYDSPGGMIIASSYEAKALGIKLGVSVREARLIYPDIIIQMPDPEKYFDVHRKFKKVLLKYTSEIFPKSVDEFVLNFDGSNSIRDKIDLVRVGEQIKKDVKNEIGSYLTINVGIGPNRFLAKLAAGLNKPDGLNVINHRNLLKTYSKLELIDLPGINIRFKTRLNLARIYTPIDFLKADGSFLKHTVFKSISGYYWYLRLRGYEIDQQLFSRKSFSQQYALGQKTSNKEELSRLIMKLSEKAGRRMRQAGYSANSVYLFMLFKDHTYFRRYKKLRYSLYSTQDIYIELFKILNNAQIPDKVSNISISLSNLITANLRQINLFENTYLDPSSLTFASDMINDKYGEFSLIPARMARMENIILKRVPFGSIQ